MPSFDRSYDHSFVGLIICSPVRSCLRLSVCFFFVWLVGLFFSLSLPLLTFCSFNSLFFFSSPYRSFVGVIVRPSIKSFLCTLLRLIDRSLVRSFVCSPVRLCLRSIVRTIICSLVRSFVRPFDHAFVCRYVFFCLARWFIFLFIPSSLYSPSVLLIRCFSFLLLIVLSSV